MIYSPEKNYRVGIHSELNIEYQEILTHRFLQV